MTHDELVERAVKWLRKAVYAKNPNPNGQYDRVWYKPACGVAVPELVSGNSGEIPDAFGWTRDSSYLIECKTTRADFLSDRHKIRTGVGTHRFYMCPPGVIRADEVPNGWGLLYCQPINIKVIVWPTRNSNRYVHGELAMMYSLLRRCEIRGFVRKCLSKKWRR